MKKFVATILLSGIVLGFSGIQPVSANSKDVQSEMLLNKRKKNRGYQKPKSKKILGIFKRKTDCGCPKH
ncbi:hypothetical protein L0657_18645 [Dyadobacter sp. CY345]|uniref:hypothetical protein n=1 Tax=Dyadobacter sp. CY345 TaxID=2909335 RepID=UPI001F202A85|nr:hypothetical protein [Dyadobacter sp. CY345]MCF2445985.1 hypothetical protein [Dyadobacter sp. CY345]